jgi:TRAP-type C4-dicarboxylate transport system permease small subunit
MGGDAQRRCRGIDTSCARIPAGCDRPLGVKPLPLEPSMIGARFDEHFLRLNRAVVIAILAAMALMVFANVALRFFTDYSILWVEEVSRYLMIWLTFLGSGLVLRHGGHIGIDTLQEKFPRQAPLMRAVIFILLFGFFAFMVWIGTRYALLTWQQTTPVLQIPVGAVYLAMPVGFALLLIHLMAMAAPYVLRNRFIVDDEFDPEAVKL